MGQSLDIPRVIPEDWKRLDLIINKIRFKLGHNASPTFSGIILSDLVASRLIATDGGKVFESVDDLTTWIAGTTDEIVVTSDGDGTITLSLPAALQSWEGGSSDVTLDTLWLDVAKEIKTVILHFRIGAASFFKKDDPPEDGLVGVFPVLRFADNSVEQVWYSEVIPNRMAIGTTIVVVIDWCYGIAPDDTASDDGKVAWKIDFLNLATGEVVATGTTALSGLSAVGTGLQTKLISTTVTTGITGSAAEDILGFRLYRDTDDENDTLAVDACFIQLHLHFIMDKLGKAR